MLRAVLLLIVLGLNGAAFGEGKALGLSLPNLNALSLWKVGESSAWGLEIGGGWTLHRGDGEENTVDNDGNVLSSEILNTKHGVINPNIGLTYLMFRDKGHEVQPLTFWNISGRMHRRSLDWGRDSEPKVALSYSLGFTIGIGVAWKPFDRVGLWATQGLTVGTEGRRNPGLSDQNLKQSSLSFMVRRPSVIAYFQL